MYACSTPNSYKINQRLNYWCHLSTTDVKRSRFERTTINIFSRWINQSKNSDCTCYHTIHLYVYYIIMVCYVCILNKRKQPITDGNQH